MPKPVWSNDVSPWARSIGEVDHIVSEFPESAFEDFRPVVVRILCDPLNYFCERGCFNMSLRAEAYVQRLENLRQRMAELTGLRRAVGRQMALRSRPEGERRAPKYAPRVNRVRLSRPISLQTGVFRDRS